MICNLGKSETDLKHMMLLCCIIQNRRGGGEIKNKKGRKIKEDGKKNGKKKNKDMMKRDMKMSTNIISILIFLEAVCT